MMRVLLIAACAVLFQAGAYAADYSVKEGSVSYTATVNMIKMMTTETIIGKNDKASGSVSTAKNGQINGKIVIAANGFKTDKPKRDEHVAQILKSTDYPEITLELDNLTIPENELDKLLAQDSFKKTVNGKLTVAGVTKGYDFNIIVTKTASKNYKLQTQRYVNFSDFGIKAPSMPIIVTDDKLLITGEITIERK